MHHEKRRHVRHETMEYALLFHDSSEEPIPAMVMDISLGGLRFQTRSKFEEGEVFLMQIGQGDSNPIQTSVEVRHVKPLSEKSALNSVGVRFMPGASEHRMRLVQWIHNHIVEEAHLVAS